MKHSQPQPSKETQQEALKIARSTQKPGQTKEQTKLIAQGIEKGIAVYKKQLKEKKRQADKAQKKVKKEKLVDQEGGHSQAIVENTISGATTEKSRTALLPWGLLIVSWVGFVAYAFLG
ncbi:DUF2956 domain-containing protein [Vibrio hippocampi]|uniref:DUF2956 domain-containing protein n=1 Tax=Vibrio hippocampi TaxID=654686 RepID=A0ABN8DEB7_9VIBR|nr:DUF2956 domain-containing protein [Vibrio hippocampi]CAH0525007.1 hypothetical protein VHP8226_00672 [Vibrio hippocampi]